MSSASSFRGFKVAGYLPGSLSHTVSERTETAKDLLWLLSRPVSKFYRLIYLSMWMSHIHHNIAAEIYKRLVSDTTTDRLTNPHLYVKPDSLTWNSHMHLPGKCGAAPPLGQKKVSSLV